MKSATLALKGALTGAALMTLATTSSAFAAEKVVATNLEPDHHVILENQYVTVMRVMIRPGQSTLFHEQHLDYVNTHIDGSPVRASYPDKPAKDFEMKSGNVKFGPHQGHSEVDKITNTGSSLNMQIAFEIKQAGPLGFNGTTRPESDAFKQVLDQKSVKGWKVTLQPGESTTVYTQKGPGVRVFFTEGRLLEAIPGHENRTHETWVHKGDASLTAAGPVELINGGDTELVFNDYELQ
ncbi:hypothetical protein [Rouxiella chamberiensis]|uniref:hypothetical protein n=1 Tax=Rouxiella chamberiensis TaxID=1513468 RepID=UPI0006988F4B|nr:hypothetical protein [Rouxiella chamberiensis]